MIISVIAQVVVSFSSEVGEKPCPDQTVSVSCTANGSIVWAYNDQPVLSFSEGDNSPRISPDGEISSGIVSIDGSERTSILLVGFSGTSFSALCNSRRIQVEFSGSYLFIMCIAIAISAGTSHLFNS